MGNGASVRKLSLTPSATIPKNINSLSDAIDRDLQLSYQREVKIVKLLLLGAGQCGKSTFVKQLKILHLQGFSPEELDYYRRHVYVNIFGSLHALLLIMRENRLRFKDTQAAARSVRMFMDFATDDTSQAAQFTRGMAEVMKQIWFDHGAQKCATQYMAKLPDSSEYFMNHLDRISATGYLPTADDVLRCRIPTSGVNEVGFQYKEFKFSLIDVGGQRNERRKWIHHFDMVTAVLFVVAVSDYDMLMEEDKQTNRMVDSLQLFKDTTRNAAFSQTNVLIFFNKTDIFIRKLKQTPITVCFPKYTGESTFQEAGEFVRHQFVRKLHGKRSCYTHFTEATNSKNVDVVFNLSFDIIVKKNLKQAGLN